MTSCPVCTNGSWETPFPNKSLKKCGKCGTWIIDASEKVIQLPPPKAKFFAPSRKNTPGVRLQRGIVYFGVVQFSFLLLICEFF